MSGLICTILLSIILTFTSIVGAKNLELTQKNFHQAINETDIAFINFYAEWCPYSRRLSPIFDAAGLALQSDLPDEEFLFGKVNCVVETELCDIMGIHKYPTLKLWKHGHLTRKEYRGGRSLEHIRDYIKHQMIKTVKVVTNVGEVNESAFKKQFILLEGDSTEFRKTFELASYMYPDECEFYRIDTARNSSDIRVQFRDSKNTTWSDFNSTTPDNLKFFSSVKRTCTTLVQEMTLTNAEGIVERGLPMMVFMYNDKNGPLLRSYTSLIEKEFSNETDYLNFFTADGNQFRRVLAMIGRSEPPVIVLDNLLHIFVFPNASDLLIEGKLRGFIEQFKSGDLHKQFHVEQNEFMLKQMGHHVAVTAKKATEKEVSKETTLKKETDKTPVAEDLLNEDVLKSSIGPINDPVGQADEVIPPEPSYESVFVNLAPSKNRYSFKDEL